MAANPSKPNARLGLPTPAILIVAVAVLLALTALGAFALLSMGVFSTPSQIIIDSSNATSCQDALLLQGDLLTSSGQPIGALVQITNANHTRRVQTESDGHFAYSLPTPDCPTQADVQLDYGGDFFHQPARRAIRLLAPSPTSLSISSPSQNVERNANVSFGLQLSDSRGRRLAGQALQLAWGNASATLITDSQGQAQYSIAFPQSQLYTLTASFAGQGLYLPASAQYFVNVQTPTCAEGTEVGRCSTAQRGFVCSSNQTLSFDCTLCGCPGDQLCWQGSQCLSPSAADAQTIAQLQAEVVQVQGQYFLGSGVVYAIQNGRPQVLTNRHVAAGLYPLSSARVLDAAGRSAGIARIRVAPGSQDLAVLDLSGPLSASPVSLVSSGLQLEGRSVVAVGSPLGLQGSVSRGVVSAIRDCSQFDSSLSGLQCVQTDAAINPGNSGGGLFDLETGQLVGINTFKLSEQNAQGLGFAISLLSPGLLSGADPFSGWSTFTPPPLCSDGTTSGSCSSDSPGYYCSGTQLQARCGTCGCPSNAPYCGSDGVCFNCPSGSVPFQSDSGQAICCAAGSSAYQTPGGSLFCCPPGTQGHADGTCS